MARYISRLIDAVTVEDIQLCLFEAMQSFGFMYTLYAARYLTQLPATVIHEELEVWSNFPDNFLNTLTSQRIIYGSNWDQWALEHDGCIATEQITNCSGPDRLSELVKQNGFQGSMLFSLKGKVLRSNGAILLNPGRGASAEEAINLWQANSRELTLICWVAHLRMATSQRRRKNNLLTQRQREVLEWSLAGKTIAEIATILGVTPATVEKHLRLARDSLGAGNTAQAILKAHLTNQIFSGDIPDETER